MAKIVLSYSGNPMKGKRVFKSSRRRKPVKKKVPIEDKYKMSLGEERVFSKLRKLGVRFVREKEFKDLKSPATNKRLRLDFWLPDHRIAIEFDGRQHFVETGLAVGSDTLPYRQLRDRAKDLYCESKGICMIRIPYTEMRNIETILESKIKRAPAV